MNVLAVMVGNAVTEAGLFAGEQLVASWQMGTAARLTADEARLQLRSAMAAFAPAGWLGEGAPVRVILGSVVPALTQPWHQALEAETGRRVLVMGPRLKTGIAITCKNPAEVGADRVADAVAARAMAGAPAVAVHLEAATAITAVDAAGALAGGVIAPGFEASSATLAHVAARLPEVEAQLPRQVLGKTTQEAIASGVFWGEVARIDGLVAMVRTELAAAGEGAASRFGEAAQNIPVLLTGQKAALLAPHLACAPALHPHLTLQGLARIAESAAVRH